MLVSLLVAILVIGLIVWLIQMLPIAEPFRTIAIAVVVILSILMLLNFGGSGIVGWHGRCL